MNDELLGIAPICELCNLATLTVKHVLLDCPALVDRRPLLWPGPGVPNLRDVLADDLPQIKRVFAFFNAINLVNLI